MEAAHEPEAALKDRKSSSKTVEEGCTEQTDSQSQESPPNGLIEDYVFLPSVPHLIRFEKLGEPAAELDNFYKEHPIVLTEDYVNVKEGTEDSTEETKWINISPKRDFYSVKKIRKLLLEQKMPKSDLWRGTLVHGIPDEW